MHPPTATLEPALRGAVAAERDAQARAGAASPDATAWPSSEQCVPQCPSGPSCSCLYWAWNADIRVYTEVGGLLEVWEPLAPRWAPRMHVRTNHYEIGTILTQFLHCALAAAPAERATVTDGAATAPAVAAPPPRRARCRRRRRRRLLAVSPSPRAATHAPCPDGRALQRQSYSRVLGGLCRA